MTFTIWQIWRFGKIFRYFEPYGTEANDLDSKITTKHVKWNHNKACNHSCQIIMIIHIMHCLHLETS
jgi:hypothetical protein